jgi:putative phosphoribosyl transferase
MVSAPGRREAAPSGPPAFRDRTEAGALLGAALREVLTRYPERLVPNPGPSAVTPGSRPGRPVVFAIPRGGVAVAAGVARALNVPLDVLMVRKIGHPEAPELGLGAIAEDGAGGAAAEPYFDADMLRRVGLTADDLADVVARERAELARRVEVYGRRPPLAPEGAGREPAADLGGEAAVPVGRAASAGAGRAGASADLTGRLVILVDDGLATGVTARAALRAVQARGAARPVLAVPVAAPGAVIAMENENGEVVTLVTPRRFRSVGEWYVDFGQLTDADVLTLLAAIP